MHSNERLLVYLSIYLSVYLLSVTQCGGVSMGVNAGRGKSPSDQGRIQDVYYTWRCFRQTTITDCRQL